jgi:hypothetical protein
MFSESDEKRSCCSCPLKQYRARVDAPFARPSRIKRSRDSTGNKERAGGAQKLPPMKRHTRMQNSGCRGWDASRLPYRGKAQGQGDGSSTPARRTHKLTTQPTSTCASRLSERREANNVGESSPPAPAPTKSGRRCGATSRPPHPAHLAKGTESTARMIL